MKKRKGVYPVRCRDNKGREIVLPSTMTLAEMVACGMKFDLKPKNEPLPDNWFAAIDETSEKQKP